MKEFKSTNTVKNLCIISLIPFIGYLIVLFISAHKIKNKTQSQLSIFGFMFLSMLILISISLIYVPVIYFCILGKIQPLALQIFLILLLSYIYFLITAICTVFILKSKMDK